MDARQFTERYGRIYRDLYRFAYALMGNGPDAEDAVGDAVLAAFEHRDQLRRDEAFKSWMFQILANRCRAKLRAAGRVEPWDPASDAGEGTAALDGADALAVREAFAALGEQDRLVVGLTVFGGYSSREIGAMIDMNPHTVRTRRKRALEQMRAWLEGGA